jgi:phosphate starvation-inducible membrane PsiE
MSEFIQKIEKFGQSLIDGFHLVGLFSLFIVVVYMAINTFIDMVNHTADISLKDVLLLFIYLEIGAMIGIYFKTHKLPVQFLIYVAITALTRVLTIDIKTMDNYRMLTISGSILIMVIAVYILNKYNNDEHCISSEPHS